MKSKFLAFISIFLSIHLLVNFYIGLHAWNALELYPAVRPYFLAIFALCVFSYIIGEILERKMPSILSDALVWIGAFWFGFMGYFFISVLALDLLRLIHLIIPFPALPVGEAYLQLKFWVGVFITLFIAFVITIGYYFATRIRVKHLELSIDKPWQRDTLDLVMMSDMHLGTIIGRHRISKMVESVNALKPDIVILAGDQVDGNPHPVIKAGLGKHFRDIKSPMGIFAITGNHEYIGDAEISCAYLEEHGVTMLRDESVEVNGIQLVGRDDRSATDFGGQRRKPIEDLYPTIDQSKPIIHLDHQPFKLEEAEQSGADLQLSGHTHHAQMWPFSYITKRVYEVSWGYKRKGKTHYYVSCGVGTWGPPVRIGSHSEIVHITLKFNNPAQ